VRRDLLHSYFHHDFFAGTRAAKRSMRIAGKENRAGSAGDADPLKGLIGKKDDILCLVIGLGDSSTLRERAVPDQVAACQAVLYVDIALMRFEACAPPAFADTCAYKGEYGIAVDCMAAFVKAVQVRAREETARLRKAGVKVLKLVKAVNR